MVGQGDKILYLSRGGNMDGAQRQLFYLLRGLDRKRFTPLVLCTHDGQFSRAIQDLNIQLIVRPLAGWRKVKNLFSRYGDAASVSRVAKDEGISLVHGSDIVLSEYVLRCALSVGVPSILHIRRPIDKRTFEKKRCSMATALVAISLRVERRLSQAAGDSRNKIVLIHDAVDQDLFKPRGYGSHDNILRSQYRTVDAVLVGMVGRIEKEKEQLAFVKIARLILNKTSRATFFIIGQIKDTSYYTEIMRYMAANGLLDHVHFTDRIADIPKVLAELDVLVSLSGGSVRYEAMMCGVPVVCGWSRQIEESLHIRHNETGFLVPERDCGDVARVLLRIIGDADLREQIGSRARQWALVHLGHSQLVERTQELYQKLLRTEAIEDWEGSP